MNFHQMLKTLHNVYEQNAEKIEQRRQTGGIGEKLNIVLLSGPTGIGKTACVQQFAKETGLALRRIDCSYEPAHFLAIHLFNCIHNVLDQKQPGFVILLDNIDQADEEHLKIIRQYRQNYLDTTVPVYAAESAGKPSAPPLPSRRRSRSSEFRKRSFWLENRGRESTNSPGMIEAITRRPVSGCGLQTAHPDTAARASRAGGTNQAFQGFLRDLRHRRPSWNNPEVAEPRMRFLRASREPEARDCSEGSAAPWSRRAPRRRSAGKIFGRQVYGVFSATVRDPGWGWGQCC